MIKSTGRSLSDLTRALLLVLLVIVSSAAVAGVKTLVSAPGVTDSRRPILIDSAFGTCDSMPRGAVIIIR